MSGTSVSDVSRLAVPGAGLEPARPFGQRLLRPPRLPFRHPGEKPRAYKLPLRLRRWEHSCREARRGRAGPGRGALPRGHRHRGGGAPDATTPVRPCGRRRRGGVGRVRRAGGGHGRGPTAARGRSRPSPTAGWRASSAPARPGVVRSRPARRRRSSSGAPRSTACWRPPSRWRCGTPSCGRPASRWPPRSARGRVSRRSPSGRSSASPPDATLDALRRAASTAVRAGAARLRVKIAPGWELEPVRAIREAHPDLTLQVDANGAFRAHEGRRRRAEPVGRLRRPVCRTAAAARRSGRARCSSPACCPCRSASTSRSRRRGGSPTRSATGRAPWPA